VGRTLQGKGLGRYLLMNALERCWLAYHQAASFAVIVDAQDAPAREFYRHYGFRPLPDERARLFLPMVTVEALFSE
jgi:predicted GNAT family N-acyltransferase